MTLMVWAFRVDPVTGEKTDLEPTPPHNEMAGFEGWRGRVWGSAPVKKLGLTLIPSLDGDNIYATGADLDRLDAEITVFLQNLGQIAAALKMTGHEDGIAFRLENMREGVRLARSVTDGEGWVYIW